MLRTIWTRRPSPGTVLGGLALIVAMSGIAVAAIPGSDGTLTACVNKDGDLRVIDGEAGKTCHGSQTTVKLASTDAAGKVADSDKLDGKDSTDFLGATQPEDWNEVGDDDGPSFRTVTFDGSTDPVSIGGCAPSTNLDEDHNSAAFYRDPWGVVHLKGLVTLKGCDWIFQLPVGYRPAKRSVFAAVSNNAFGRISVGRATVAGNPASGIVQSEVGSEWISLDGISFRCAPSGENGCP